MIFIDVDSKDLSQGLSSPPAAFLQQSFLTTLHSLVSPRGKCHFNFLRNVNILNILMGKVTSEFQMTVSRKAPNGFLTKRQRT